MAEVLVVVALVVVVAVVLRVVFAAWRPTTALRVARRRWNNFLEV